MGDLEDQTIGLGMCMTPELKSNTRISKLALNTPGDNHIRFTQEDTPDNKPKQLERKRFRLTIVPANNEFKDKYRGRQMLKYLASPMGKGKLPIE